MTKDRIMELPFRYVTMKPFSIVEGTVEVEYDGTLAAKRRVMEKIFETIVMMEKVSVSMWWYEPDKLPEQFGSSCRDPHSTKRVVGIEIKFDSDINNWCRIEL